MKISKRRTSFVLFSYKFLKENGRRYVFVFGEKENKRVAVVWRPTKAIDLKKDKQIINETITGFCPDEYILQHFKKLSFF